MESKQKLKNNIKKNFSKYREIQKKNISPIENEIAKNLMELYPSFNEENAIDWVCEIINCINQSELNKVLTRMNDLYGKPKL
jgi:hypothetical protein